MKIGIITYSRIYNYGSALQTYALNKYLANQGLDVQTIDYVQKDQEKAQSSIYEPCSRALSIARNIQVFIYKKKILESRRRFGEFLDLYINKTKPYRRCDLALLNNSINCFICGSDQIWNMSYYGFDCSYMLDFVNDKTKCLSYAASIGLSRITEKEYEVFKTNLNGFSDVLVREKTASNILLDCIGYAPRVVVDPVFLIECSEWEKIAGRRIIKDRYILCYYIGNIEGMRKCAQRIKKATGYKTVVVRMNLRDCFEDSMKYYECGPVEFVNLIRNAEMVFTNSFHAMAFSIIFEKRFWVFSSKENGFSSQSRIEDLLDLLSLKGRMVNRDSTDCSWDNPINYNSVKSIINDRIAYSQDVLMDDINSIVGTSNVG